jgi:ankyrin repeat protein
VERLLKKGADLEAKDLNGQTPLFYAVGNIEAVKLLLEKGANPESKDRYGRTPLSRAVAHGYKEVVKLLMDIHSDEGLAIVGDGLHNIRSWDPSKMHRRKRKRQEQKRRKQERIDRTVYSAEN